jgi:hypothetical protein
LTTNEHCILQEIALIPGRDVRADKWPDFEAKTASLRPSRGADEGEQCGKCE